MAVRDGLVVGGRPGLGFGRSEDQGHAGML